MIKQLFQELKNYFNTIENPTEQERILATKLNAGHFPITCVHRDDLEAKGYDIQKIDDGQMMELAARMSKDYKEQLYWGSLDIIAGEILEFPKSKDVNCPKCGSENIRFDIHNSMFHCETCLQAWDDKLYVLVEFPEDSSHFEEEKIGYPCFTDEDNGARYVPEYEYIEHFKRTRHDRSCFKAVRWPESQTYLPGGDLHTEDCRPILDEFGIEDFGENAVWVPVVSNK